MGSPVRYTQHGQPSSDVEIWLGTYRVSTPGVNSAGNTTVRLDLDNVPQPDILLRIEHGGSSRVGEDGHLEGPPELVVEVAASSASYDLHDKLQVYRRNGVPEYIVWRVLDDTIDWLVLRDGVCQPLAPDEAGVVRSEVFPGLWLAVSALLAGDMTTVLATLQLGLASPEHAAFVERLRATDRRSTFPPRRSGALRTLARAWSGAVQLSAAG